MLWNLEEFSNNLALLDEYGQSLTYQELKGETDKLAGKIERRTLVFSLCKNTIGSVMGYISFLEHEIVPVLLNAHLEPELLEELVSLYRPVYIWIPFDQKEQFKNAESIYDAYGYVLLKTNYDMKYPLFDELGLLLTTSGSTGSPKFVRQSYTNILDNAKSIAKYLQINDKERPITTLPMNYTYGLSIINSHLLVGAAILITEKSIMQKEFWEFVKKEKATSFGGVPYTYEILDKIRFMRMDLPNFTTMTQAGGKLTPELHEKFAKWATQNNKKFIVMYGQCEATARMGYLPAEKAVEKKGSMGIPIPGGIFHLIDAQGEEITTPYTTGELVYEGKNVTLGYAECGDDLIKGDERNGILRTGDMAQFDEDTYYYIVGRKKRFLKIYGNRVNLDEVERLIKGQYKIEAAVSGIDDHMYIFLTDESQADSVKSFVAEKTRLNAAAFQVVPLDEIPKNDSGKILYKELATYYDKQENR